MALAKASAVQAKGLESKITWSIEVLEYSNESETLTWKLRPRGFSTIAWLQSSSQEKTGNLLKQVKSLT